MTEEKTTTPNAMPEKPPLGSVRTPLIVGGPLMRALSSWAKLGNRSVTIKYKSNTGERMAEERTIWVWDYELEAGKHINIEQDIPHVADLLEIKIEEAGQELERLEKLKREAKQDAKR